MKKLLILIPGLFFILNVYSQDCKIENLVFEGAGIRGIAYAGVIQELEERNKLHSIQKVGGTSAGAITALMISLGYSSKEVREIISSTKFRKFNDGRFIFIGGVIRMRKKFGWYRGDRFSKWIAGIIENKTGDADITLEELGSRGYKDLYVTATSINKQRLIVLSKDTYPRMKVKDAVRISMSIPLYFKTVFIDDEGIVYKKYNSKDSLDIVIDGGIVANFPIFLFDSLRTDSLNKVHRIPNPGTIGIRIDSYQQIREDKNSRTLVYQDVEGFNDYFTALYIFTIENLNRHDLTDADWSRTISISSEGISPRIKNLSAEQKEILFRSGKDYTSEYLKQLCGGN